MTITRRPLRLSLVAAAATTLFAVTTACGSPSPDARSAADEADSSAAEASDASDGSDASDAGGSTGAPADVTTSTAGEATCGGEGIDTSASVTSAHDLLVDAPADTVWKTLTDVETWSDWQSAVTSIERLDSGPLAKGSQFRWTTPVPESDISAADTLRITSTVRQIDPGHCVLWEGPAVGDTLTIDKGTHLWTVTETDDGTLVHTEESWDAEVLDSLEGDDAEAAAQMLGGGLVSWLDDLRTTAEAAR
ncbi:SRPBCC family protein [Brachybacterium halotolerans subsp. kimchii]|uniref:SRPBCC family protein n=1 Tax=Brachybacterium halotolerans TaxID=2795215 RepID=UPI001E4D0998|nr:SRPBCC family protein [Brachybacterium halotolerans]UEJ84278.1 SRPBCC family protein [Brachybacterium halotolerans subsp. kimchii]